MLLVDEIGGLCVCVWIWVVYIVKGDFEFHIVRTCLCRLGAGILFFATWESEGIERVGGC